MTRRIDETKRRLVDQLLLGPTFRRFGSSGIPVAQDAVDQIFELLGIEELSYEMVASAQVTEDEVIMEGVRDRARQGLLQHAPRAMPVRVEQFPRETNTPIGYQDWMCNRVRLRTSALIITKEPGQ